MHITCATYNILRGHHTDLILKNIRFLIGEGADVLCLQEAEVSFEDSLRELLAHTDFSDWDMHHAHVGVGGNVAILWNKKKLRLIDTKVVRLHKLRIPFQLSALRELTDKIERAALVGSFEWEKKVLQVTSAHFAWEGGEKHRMRQVHHLRETIEEQPADFRILAGDFNTIGLSALRHSRERTLEETLGRKYVNALPKLHWSFDIAYTDPRDKLRILASLYYLGLKFRNRLDYIFATSLNVVSAAMHDLPGSDHRPLLATFSIAATSPRPVTIATQPLEDLVNEPR
ncbi:hypothetical protein COU17_01970 [Candidatus Kaiserbacteria bacterium CG10_big_fil_rev_8_21_14_0_10_49_17]|uniref:Endonuclease/exonuclease/phosphatase domain-containing protein n=1 Tax=Candidatus Kaiserbacteria bacterium CG10_big_fil_rev_8_21_14_0_10_49_17 TaxID=1974609 RepID=A0A2M6WEC7_9BACT|nr:MAG: hypothetical protein COU17_01970 [Candidatus Kaiserbacteria bacterium CG10_big_fil_rev_8_21_14_0_10_49_17]